MASPGPHGEDGRAGAGQGRGGGRQEDCAHQNAGPFIFMFMKAKNSFFNFAGKREKKWRTIKKIFIVLHFENNKVKNFLHS